MRRKCRKGVLAAALVIAMGALAGCGDDEGGGHPAGSQVQYTGKTTQSPVSAASVFTAMSSSGLFAPGCRPTASH